MRGFLIKTLQDVRASYWFVPALMIVLAMMAAYGMQRLDRAVSAADLQQFGLLTVTSAEGARSVLSTIAGSIITVAGTTFSITIVAVSFASGNYGPRLVGNFMRDRGNQVTLGVFIATFVYNILILQTVRGSLDATDDMTEAVVAFVPHLSILLGIGLAIVSIGVLVYFFHHVPETIDIGKLTARIGRQLRKDLEESFPEEATEGAEPAEASSQAGFERAVAGRTAVEVRADATGYVRAIDFGRVEALAEKNDLYVRLQYRPGDFAIGNDVLMEIWHDGGGAPSDDLRDEIAATFALGAQRTPHQNPVFLIDELIEIVTRALSPGVNDPFTAMACFDWLQGALSDIAGRRSRAPILGSHGRVMVHVTTFDDVLAAVFDRSRPYVAADRNASLHVLHMLAEIAEPLPAGDRRRALMGRFHALVEAVRAGRPAWLDEFNAQAAEAERLVDSPDAARSRRRSSGWLGGQG
jgi:uncharacterized membrane protein